MSAMKCFFLLSSALALTIKEVQDDVAFANESLSGYGECNRPNRWCSTNDNSHIYLFQDCNGDGIKDQVCYWKHHIWLRISGNCDVLNNGHASNPKCDKLKQQAEDKRKYIYITGTDHKVYRQPLEGLSAAKHWEQVGIPSVISLAVYKDYFIGMGTDKQLYKQSFALVAKGIKWTHLGRGSIIDGDVLDDTFYGVGTNGLIYSQSISKMTPHTHWTQRTSKGHVISVAVHESSNFLWGVGKDGRMWKIPLNNLGGNGWVEIHHNGKCYHLSISGDDIYCRGSAKKIWHQKISTLTASSAWTNVARGAAMSVMVPKVNVNVCKGSLLSAEGDDFACDKITDAETCKTKYERSGKTDTYLQCVPSPATPGGDVINCLAREPCTLR